MSETIVTKQCSTCKEVKPISEFHDRPTAKDGYRGQCKKCIWERRKRRYSTQEGGDLNRARASRHRKSEKGRTSHRRYRATDKGRATQSRANNKCNNKFPEKRNARRVVNNAIQAGKLLPVKTLTCSCGEQAKQYHHPDYSKPLEIIGLCIKCHNAIHRITF